MNELINQYDLTGSLKRISLFLNWTPL